MHVFGNIGYPYFDKKRKAFQGIALIVIILALVMGVFACLALEGNTTIMFYCKFAIDKSIHLT